MRIIMTRFQTARMNAEKERLNKATQIKSAVKAVQVQGAPRSEKKVHAKLKMVFPQRIDMTVEQSNQFDGIGQTMELL